MAERRRRRTEIIDKLRRGERMGNELPIKITLMSGAELPKYARPGDSGFDLVAQEDYVVEPGQTVKMRTGIALEIPQGYEVQIRPRSGISANTKLRVANSPGTGDSSFRGEICVLVDNIAQKEYEVDCDGLWPLCHNALHTLDGTGDSPLGNVLTEDSVPVATYIIRKGERIAQAVIAPVYRAAFEVVAELSETARGVSGFGHTGT
ncbi:deoxyuridine 5'-triphosphate nucleotidohydrolase [Paenibacillus sp. FSL R7-0128]|uniref:dUTP diphosphatase n=2 Tax=Paenibacillus sp. FSL R7-0128 TaxID=2954529 RepID=UPI0030F89E49